MTPVFDLANRIRSVLQIDQSANAFNYKHRWYSWGEVAAFMQSLELLFSEANLPEGAPIAVLLRNNPACVSTVMQVLASKRCVVSINPFQSQDKILKDVGQVEISALVALDTDWDTNPALADALKEKSVLGISINTTTLTAKLHEKVPFVHPKTINLGNTAILMLTSGTTGPSKRIPLHYDKLENSLLSAAAYEEKQNTSGQPTLKTTPAMLVTPLVHIGGMYFALAAVVSGRPLLIIDKFNVEECVEGIAQYKLATVALSPTALVMLLDANVDKAKLSSLRAIRCGSAPLSPELQARFEQTYDVPVLDSYGATEFAGAVAGWSLKDHQTFSQTKRGSVGRAQPGNELRVVDAATGDVLPASSLGLLEVRSAQMDRTRWIRTNDLAELDEDGFLYIRGRADAAIIRGGFKILPAEVEAVIKTNENIKEACVLGLPDQRLGAVPVAAVELKPGAQLNEAELLSFLKNKLVAYQVPTQVRIVQALPRTPSLKICQPDVLALFA